jgi:hypothetical protein
MTALASLRLHPADESDLRWLLSREFEGDLGMRSGFHDFLRQMELRANLRRSATTDPRFKPRQYLHVSSAVEHGAAEGIADEALLGAAGRYRRVRRRWDALAREHQDVLAAVYGSRRYDGLTAFRHPGSSDDLSGVVLVVPEARTAFRRSRSDRGLLDWLQRLSVRFEKQRHRKKTVSSREQRRDDEQLVADLVLAAEVRLIAAVRAYDATRPRREVRRAA